MRPVFPVSHRRAYAEFAEVPEDQVMNNGTEFSVRCPVTGKGYFWNFVHPWEETKVAFPESFHEWESYLFTCSNGIEWVIHPL